jgi:hypothetical protein
MMAERGITLTHTTILRWLRSVTCRRLGFSLVMSACYFSLTWMGSEGSECASVLDHSIGFSVENRDRLAVWKNDRFIEPFY